MTNDIIEKVLDDVKDILDSDILFEKVFDDANDILEEVSYDSEEIFKQALHVLG